MRIGNARQRISSSLGLARGGSERPLPPAGRHKYGVANIQALTWGEDGRLTLGSFCSIADNVIAFLGGIHRTDWISTFPFVEIPTTHRMLGDRSWYPQSS